MLGSNHVKAAYHAHMAKSNVHAASHHAILAVHHGMEYNKHVSAAHYHAEMAGRHGSKDPVVNAARSNPEHAKMTNMHKPYTMPDQATANVPTMA